MWDGTAHAVAPTYLTGSHAFDELPDPPPAARPLPYRRESLGELRARILEFARGVALPATRASDLALVTSGVATNGIRYGGEAGTVRLWRESNAPACEFRDDGVITDPFAGRRRPSSADGDCGSSTSCAIWSDCVPNPGTALASASGWTCRPETMPATSFHTGNAAVIRDGEASARNG